MLFNSKFNFWVFTYVRLNEVNNKKINRHKEFVAGNAITLIYRRGNWGTGKADNSGSYGEWEIGNQPFLGLWENTESTTKYMSVAAEKKESSCVWQVPRIFCAAGGELSVSFDSFLPLTTVDEVY